MPAVLAGRPVRLHVRLLPGALAGRRSRRGFLVAQEPKENLLKVRLARRQVDHVEARSMDRTQNFVHDDPPTAVPEHEALPGQHRIEAAEFAGYFREGGGKLDFERLVLHASEERVGGVVHQNRAIGQDGDAVAPSSSFGHSGPRGHSGREVRNTRLAPGPPTASVNNRKYERTRTGHFALARSLRRANLCSAAKRWFDRLLRTWTFPP